MLVLTQLSAGAFWVDFALHETGWSGALGAVRTYHSLVALSLDLLAIGASTLHLGRPHLAFRALIGLRTSWLSREALGFALFAKLAVAYAALQFQSDAQDILKRLDFLVVQDMYSTTETAQLAHLVLPAAGWGEKEGTFINSERRIGLLKKVSRAPGEALADFYIFKLIAVSGQAGRSTYTPAVKLFIAMQMVLAHGGRLEASSSDAEGTTVSVHLPRQAPPAHPSSAPPGA